LFAVEEEYGDSGWRMEVLLIRIMSLFAPA
jgi:hypothetical protein